VCDTAAADIRPAELTHRRLLPFHSVTVSEFHRFRGSRKGREGSLGVLEVEDLGVAVVLIVHIPQTGVGVQHGLPCFYPVILHQLAGDPHPNAIVESADLRLGIGHQLPGGRLDLAGLDVQLALKNVGCAKGSHPGLIALHGCQVINAGFLQKFTNPFHIVLLLDFIVQKNDDSFYHLVFLYALYKYLWDNTLLLLVGRSLGMLHTNEASSVSTPSCP